MTRSDAGPGCHELVFEAAYRLAESAEVALEDYARVLTRAGGAEVIRSSTEPALVGGVHVCGAPAPPSSTVLLDLQAFARRLAGEDGGGGLGWS